MNSRVLALLAHEFNRMGPRPYPSSTHNNNSQFTTSGGLGLCMKRNDRRHTLDSCSSDFAGGEDFFVPTCGCIAMMMRCNPISTLPWHCNIENHEGPKPKHTKIINK